MSTDFSDMSMMQLSDSFFPTGLYTMSSGLETLFDEKKIHTIDDIQSFIETVSPSRLVLLTVLHYQVHMILHLQATWMES